MLAWMQKHAVLTLMGLLLAAASVAWLQPNTNGGTAFVVVISVLLVNLIGLFLKTSRNRRKQGLTLFKNGLK
jgi:hypothetical protein